jgi:hypothetical protein
MKAPYTLMWNKSKTLLVPVGDPEARFFAYPEGYPIPDGLPIKIVEKVANKMMEPPVRKAAEGKEKSNG